MEADFDLKMKEDPQLAETNVQDGQIDSGEGLQRRLENRHVQLIAIGGSIGTALFVTIGMASRRVAQPVCSLPTFCIVEYSRVSTIVSRK